MSPRELSFCWVLCGSNTTTGLVPGQVRAPQASLPLCTVGLVQVGLEQRP